MRMMRPPPRVEPGRSRRSVVKLGNGRRLEVGVSLVSWMAAIKIFLE